MNWAIVRAGGKQYKIAEGDNIKINRSKDEKDDDIKLDVLLVKTDKSLKLGDPVVKKAKVSVKALKRAKEKKIRVVKFKSKSRYLRTYGHRQEKLSLTIEKISL